MTTDTDTSPFAALRARFPGIAQRAHLDVASRSLIPASSLEIAQAHLQERVNGVIDKDRYFGLVETVRQSFARLVNADPIEIAMTKNVSEGLNIVAASIDWRPGDEVILCSDIEHPNNLYTWRNQERLGVVVRDLPSPDGLFPLEAVLERLGEGSRVRVVTVSATSFKPACTWWWMRRRRPASRTWMSRPWGSTRWRPARRRDCVRCTAWGCCMCAAPLPNR